jgi:hypothetical protein
MEVTEAEREAARERLRVSAEYWLAAGITEEEILAAIAEDNARERRRAERKLAKERTPRSASVSTRAS